MRIKISSILRQISAFLKMAFTTPNEVLEILGIFRNLLEDEGNFLDVGEWGKMDEENREIMPFSFSERGLKKAKEAFSNHPSVYKSGVAGMTDTTESLPYFLTQFITLLPLLKDWLELQEPKDEEKKRIVDSLGKKLKSLNVRVEVHKIYKNIIKKKYTKADKDRIRTMLMGLIDKMEKEFEGIERLTPEEEAYIKVH